MGRILVILLLALGFVSSISMVAPARAQQSTALALPNNVPAPASAATTAPHSGDMLDFTAKTPYEFYIVLLIVGFAAFVMIVLLIVYLRVRAFNEELFMRTFTITLIVLAAVFLIVAGYSSQQVAPAFGLLGTIAGYIMGKMDAGSRRGDPAPNAAGLQAPVEPDQPGQGRNQ